MHLPWIVVGCLTALTCAVLVLPTSCLQRSSQTIFNGGILLAVGLLIVSALPILSHLSWTGWVDHTLDQVVALFHFLEVAYTVLTL
ncbi:hypothetical protein [Bradyrhizobium sp. CCGE-LA001]|uniref:hypothetical protein n=1 Tax=Bradyrhizobium sp. CCGE-LA001 TaxID=1223566 RepID=UPI000745B7EF|nr:hypothetical protein [Bradyrhizobium sp. CCGE-LA001]AMA59150.1 hypothetical protein BCCGELA001_24675 [Bradyrhizobium sp. CCGE-LA001]